MIWYWMICANYKMDRQSVTFYLILSAVLTVDINTEELQLDIGDFMVSFNIQRLRIWHSRWTKRENSGFAFDITILYFQNSKEKVGEIRDKKWNRRAKFKFRPTSFVLDSKLSFSNSSALISLHHPKYGLNNWQALISVSKLNIISVLGRSHSGFDDFSL